MRPVRFIFLVTFFVALPIFLTCWSLLSTKEDRSKTFKPAYDIRSSRLQALFSFTTPSSLFPPSAVISLTNDNSTFFLARPAAFGPSLPSRGLSGELWVGKGFGDDAILQEGGIYITGWELGCSDVPGWREDERKRLEAVAAAKPQKRSLIPPNIGTEPLSSDPSQLEADSAKDDGTDDHLHHPLPDSNPATPSKPGEPANALLLDKTKRPNHADIESLQESADIAGKIVMLVRGGCGFLEKVKWAQRRGGIAVIVGDNERSAPLTIMYAKGDASNVTIPALFTSYNAAHLLSSLVPNKAVVDETTTNSKTKNSKEKIEASRKEIHKLQDDKPIFTSTTAQSKKPTSVPLQKAASEKDGKQKGWVQNALGAIGLMDGSPSKHTDDSRRPPSSGNIDWVLMKDWDEDDVVKTSSVTTKSRAISTSTASTKTKSTDVQNPAADDFVIGVQDWRDADLVAPKSTASSKPGSPNVKPGKEKNIKSTNTAKAAQPVETMLKGGSITPGSGEYEHQELDQSQKSKDSTLGNSKDENPGNDDSPNNSWFSIFGSREPESPSSEDQKPGVPNPPEKKPGDKPEEHEGLWVTLTPTSVSTSPFFDTLLVLVVSPLVTLSVVYALLLLRSRIRRRRWRAPKSVVERLPVRTYHTMSTSSSTTSSQVTSPEHSSVTSPLLRPQPQDVSRRPRQRSQTTIGVFPGSSLESSSMPIPQFRESPPSEKPKTKEQKRKRYKGVQVECVVCLEDYVDGESQVMSLPCGHEFHAECITPWLVNRRRTCPICKGDVVRSLARASHSYRGALDQRHENEQTSDDVQDRVVQTTNEEPSAAIPIPDHTHDDSEEDEDIERGQPPDEQPLIGETAAQAADRQSPWRNVIARSLSRLSGETVWRQSTPVDRSR